MGTAERHLEDVARAEERQRVRWDSEARFRDPAQFGLN
jgi:hypothetical protein